MDRIQETGIDFKSFEQQCYDTGMAFARMLMTTALADLDEKILKTRNTGEYRAKDLRPLTIKTLMGEVTVKRRLYRHTGEGGRTEYVHLLDRAIGLDTIGRFSMGLVLRMADVIAECSYRAAAGTISFLSGQSISHGGFWNAVQAAGKRIADLDGRRAKEAKSFRHKGTKRVKALQEEFDGVWVNMQGKDRPKTGHKLEMKLSSAYEGIRFRGKGKNGEPSRSLVNPIYTAGFESAEEFFYKKEGQIGAVYDLNEIDVRLINGDGGGRVAGFGERAGCESHFQLDHFHIKRELVRSGISEEDRDVVTGLLEQKKASEALGRLKALGESEPDEEKKKRILAAFGYLNNRRDSLIPILKRGLELPAPSEDADAYGPMGAMESTVCGVIALRMKKRRASFTKAGGTHLAEVLCLKRSGRLDETISGLSEMRLPKTLEEVAATILSAAKAPKKDGKGYVYAKTGGIPFEGAATTNGRTALKGLVSLRGLADLGFRQVGGR